MEQSVYFEAFSYLHGKSYYAERGRLLQNNLQLRQSVQAYSTNPDWRLRIETKILKGWMSDQKLYNNVLSELDAVDFEKERKTAAGIARIWDMYALRTQREYGEEILPFAWEVITKFYDDWPVWKVTTFLHMIGAVPVEESIEPVLYLLEEAQAFPLKLAAAQALAKLPREAVIKRLAVVEEKHRAILRAITDARDRF